MKPFIFQFFIFSFIFSLWGNFTPASEGNAYPKNPSLTIRLPSKTIVFTRQDLLSRKDVTSLQVENDPAYEGRRLKSTYRAVPLADLFEGSPIREDALLQFKCLDGFSAPISLKRVLNRDSTASIAFIAIEEENKPWPPIRPPTNMKSPGPYYLIWKNPHLSHIQGEEWPYQLEGFEIKKSITESFPHIIPSHNLRKNDALTKGFNLFLKNCFTCHTMNLEGESKLGPDLNVPMNPTEYLTPSALRILIRNPQALRIWPLAKMHGFPEKELSKEDIENIIIYLKYMVKHKVHSSVP